MPNNTATCRLTAVTSRWGIHPALYREVTLRAFTAPAVLLTLVLTGCNAAAPTAPLPATASPEVSGNGGANSTHQAAPQRPIEGHCEAETVEVVPISPGVIRRTSFGTCQLSHLGRTRLRSVADTNLVTLEQVGEHTYTAANGDLLYGTSAGTATLTPPSTLHFTGVTTISGGTGRFANAVGVMQVEGTSDLAGAQQKSSFSYNGWIRY
jgi:hypothetical protein